MSLGEYEQDVAGGEASDPWSTLPSPNPENRTDGMTERTDFSLSFAN